MKGIDRLHGIAEDVGRTVWLRDLGAALSETADAIEGGTSDPSGYESDVLAWVEKNGGLDAVRERLMPEGMSWPFYEDGEPVRLGEHWQQDEYDWSITSIEFAEDGVRFENKYADAFYRYGERVKRPAPPVLDADGVEVRKGDTVWSTTGDFDGKRTVKSIHVDEGEPPYAFFEEGREPWSFLCCCLTHRAPVLAADGKPLREGETVWDIEDEKGYPHTVASTELDGLGHVKTTCEEPTLASVSIHPSRLTHEAPDSWGSVWMDVSNGCETPQGMERRCRALAERGE